MQIARFRLFERLPKGKTGYAITPKDRSIFNLRKAESNAANEVVTLTRKVAGHIWMVNGKHFADSPERRATHYVLSKTRKKVPILGQDTRPA